MCGSQVFQREDALDENAGGDDVFRIEVAQRHQLRDLYDGGFRRCRHDRAKVARRLAIDQVAPAVALVGFNQREIGFDRVLQHVVATVDFPCLLAFRQRRAVAGGGKHRPQPGAGRLDPRREVALRHQLQLHFAATVEIIENLRIHLARGLEVIQAFTPQRPLLSISQISQKTGIPRAAVRRCLYTLSKLGFVYAEDGKNFQLRPRILALGHAWLASTPLARSAQPVLRHLSEMLNESCSIATLDGDDILYIARASSSRIMTIDLDIGSRLPAWATSMGRVLLSHQPEEKLNDMLGRVTMIRYTPQTVDSVAKLRAELKRVHQQGYALNDQELEMGLRSLAVPLFNAQGQVQAALNVGVHAGQMTAREMIERVLPELQKAARELTLLLR